MSLKLCLISILVGVLAIAACEKRIDTVAELQIDFEWTPENECRDYSPEIRIGRIPANTARFRLQMEDLYCRGCEHGDWEELPHDGSGRLGAGAMRLFRGPCPPAYAQNPYQFTIKALDAAGVVIGEGRQARLCCDFKK